MKKRTMLASLFAAFALTATAGVGGILTTTANAEISGLGMFKIEDGASVRITGTEEIQDGLRFQVKMDETTVAKIVDAETLSSVQGTDANNDYKLYAVIAPADVVTDGDFTKVDRENWVEIKENTIYYSTKYSCYYANAVLTNVKATNRYRAFTMGAVIEKGTDSVWAAPANEGYRTRSLYQTVNLATLSADEDTAKIINNADTTYKDWFGESGYPLVVTTEAQLNSIITDVTGNKYSFAEKNIYVDNAVKATETYTNAVAQDGALNAIAAELNATYYDVTFNSDEDTALYTYKAKSGTTAVYNGWSFSKPADGLNNTYTNNGWDEELGAVNANVTYTADYSAVATDVKTKIGDIGVFKNYYWEKATINGEEKTAVRLAGFTGNNANAALLSTGNYEWAEGKALTFTAYNNSSVHEYTFRVDMLDDTLNLGANSEWYRVARTFYTVEPNQTQTITVYAEDFDYSTTKYVRILAAYVTTSAQQGGVPIDGTDSLDLHGFDVSFYDFKFEDKAKPTTEDYKQATDLIVKDQIIALNSNKDYVHGDGDYSFVFSNYGARGQICLNFTREYDWAKTESVTFYVYNPYTSSYFFHIGYTNGKSENTTSTNMYQNVEIKAGQWNAVTVETEGFVITEGSALVIYLDKDYAKGLGANGTFGNTNNTNSANTVKWRALRLYVDDFSVVEGEGEAIDTTSDDYLWTQAVLDASYAFEVNTDTKYILRADETNQYSLCAKAAGTWNAFMFTGKVLNYATDGIKSVTFYIYNPTDYTFYCNLGYCTSAVAGQGWSGNGATYTQCNVAINASSVDSGFGAGWTEITVDTSAWADGVYLRFSIGHTGSNPTSGAEDGLWATFMTNGLYFDNFVVTYK